MRIGVVVPTHNRGELVTRAVDSVLAQALESDDVVVVDDGSGDGSAERIERRYAAEPRVRVLRRPPRGPSAARNAGFAASRGDLVCFLDDDDWLLPHALAWVREAFAAHPRLAFLSLEGQAWRDGVVVEERIVRRTPGWHGAGFAHAELRSEPLAAGAAAAAGAGLLSGDLSGAVLDGDLFYLSGLFMRREAIERAGPFVERYRLFEDWDFHVRLCTQGPGALLDAAGFARTVGRGDQLSRRTSTRRQAIMHLRVLRHLQASGLETRPREIARLDAAVRDARYWLGRVFIEAGHVRSGRRLLAASLRELHKPVKSAFLLARSRLSRSAETLGDS